MRKKPTTFIIPPQENHERKSDPPVESLSTKSSNYTTTIHHNYYQRTESMENMTPMEPIAIAKTAASLFKPFLKKNKAIKQITSEITEAANTSLLELWEKIKPIFIEEFEKKEQLSENAENESIVAHEILKRVEKDSDTKQYLEQKIKEIQIDKPLGNTTIIGSDNITTTGTIRDNQGDVIIGGSKGNDATK